MKIGYISPCWSLLLCLALPAVARAEPKSVWTGDVRLLQRVAVTAEGTPARDLLGALSAKAGIDLSCCDELADAKVLVFGTSRRLHDLLEDLAALFNGSWSRRVASHGSRKYRLELPLVSRRIEARLARADAERMMAQLEKQVRALDETPGQLARRAEDDPIRRRLEDTRFGGRVATQLYSWLTPDQREILFVEDRVRIPFAVLSPDQQALVRTALDDTLSRRSADPDEQLATRTGGTAPINQSEDLRRFGITFELHRQAGHTYVNVKLGTAGDLFLGYLDNAQRFLLPAHGDPYTGTAVSERAPLPAARVTGAAIRDVPWPDRLRELSRAAGICVVADYYRMPPVSRAPATPGAQTVPASSAGALDALCQRDGYMWWTRGRTLLLRKRDWYTQQLREIPDRWMLAAIRQLESRHGTPAYADVLRLRELTVAQLTGLYLLAERQPFDELYFTGLHELLEFVAAAPRPPQGLLPVGQLTTAADPDLERRASLIQTTLTRRQMGPFARFLALQPGLAPLEPTAEEVMVRFICASPKPGEAARGYHYLEVGIRWGLRMRVPVSYAGAYDLYLPLSLPDDRRYRAEVELIP